MSYFIKMRHPHGGWKPVGRVLYPTKAEAVAEAERLNLQAHGQFAAEDADHEPGRSLLRNRDGRP